MSDACASRTRDAGGSADPAGRRDVRGRGARRRGAGDGAPARWCSTPRCPATRRSSPTRATPGRSSRSPTRTSATTARTPTTTRRRRPFCRGVIVRDLARRHSNWRGDRVARRRSSRGTACPAIAGIDTRRLTRHLRDTGAVPGAFGTDEAAVRAAASASEPTDGIDLVATVTTSTPYTVRRSRRAVPRRRLRLRHQAHDPAPPRRRRVLRRRGAGDDARGRRARRAARTASSSRTVPATRPRSSARPTRCAGSSGSGVPLFGICLGHQILGQALGGTHVQAAVRPPRRQPSRSATCRPARWRSRARTTTTRSTRTRSTGTVEITHVNLNDGVCEGLRVTRRAGVLGAAPSRGRPRTARRRVPVRRVHDADGRGR